MYEDCLMIRNPKLVEHTIREYERKHPMTLEQKFAILNAMHRYARRFGHFTIDTAAEGIENDIALAKILNANVRDSHS